VGHQGPADVRQLHPHTLGPQHLNGDGETGQLARHHLGGLPPDLEVDRTVAPTVDQTLASGNPLDHPRAEDVAQDVRRAGVGPDAHPRRRTLVIERRHDIPPCRSQIEALGSLHRITGPRHRAHPAHAKGPLPGVGVGDEVPDLVLDHQAERVHHAP